MLSSIKKPAMPTMQIRTVHVRRRFLVPSVPVLSLRRTTRQHISRPTYSSKYVLKIIGAITTTKRPPSAPPSEIMR